MSKAMADLSDEQSKQKALIEAFKRQDDLTQNPTSNITQLHDVSRDYSRDRSRDIPREVLPNLPTRDEIQEFSFRQRDALKVKVQTELNHEWQKELEDIALAMNVKKLELYRYIFGVFLGKVKPRK